MVPSVIIPAHNEAVAIDRLLTALLGDALDDDVDVIVVANGCTDTTAARARAHGVRVIETPIANKAHALRLGDDAATTFPRAYLDADVVISPDALQATFAALREPGVHCAAPRLDLDARDASPLVRHALHAWLALPWSMTAPVGSGCYAVSAAGHARIAPFPDLIADDAYVSSAFTPAERHTVADVTFTAHAPRTLRALIARRRRVQRGNRELARLQPAHAHTLAHTSPRAALRLGARRPALLPGLAILTVVHALAARDPNPQDWGRDETSRTAETVHPRRTLRPTVM